MHLAGGRFRAVVLHAGPGVVGDERLKRARVQEGHETAAGGGSGSTLCFNPCGRRSVVDGNVAAQKARAAGMFWDVKWIV